MEKRLSIAAGLLAAAAAASFFWHPSVRPEPSLTAASAPIASKPPPDLVIYVAGAVRSPGVYRLPEGSRAVAAVRAAGGATAAAVPGGVNLAERLEDGEEVFVPDAASQARAPRAAHTHGRGKRGRHRRAKHHRAEAPGNATAPVDLNAADAGSLGSVPGIGEALADRIVVFRELNGPFERLEDLLDVAGMSPAKLDRAQAYLKIRS